MTALSGRSRRRLVASVGVGTLLLGTTVLLAPGVSFASSHREAPLIAGDPRSDNTDTYAFVSPDKPDTVTLVANWYPFEEANGGPNFYAWATDARYTVKIDNNGDGNADVTYTWLFANHYRDSANQFLYNTGVVNHLTDPTLNFWQTYTLYKTARGTTTTLLRNRIATPSFVGKASMPSYSTLRQEAIDQGKFYYGQTFVGQADDPFFLDLRVFDLLYGANLSEAGHDTLSGYNVNSIALQVPRNDLALNADPAHNPVVGIWSTTDRRLVSTTGVPSNNWVQVSRLGSPLVNEAVVPLRYKDAFNSIPPSVDHTVTPVVNAVKDPIVPKLIKAVYGIPAPATPRNDLVEIFLTGICKACGPIQADLNSQLLNRDVAAARFVPSEELRLNMSVPTAASPNRLGVLGGDLQGYPNGRRLADDVIDITLQAAEGAAQSGQLVSALAAGDGVNANDKAFGSQFPYLALPNEDAVNQAAGSGSSAAAAPAGRFPVGGGAAPFGAALLAIVGVSVSLVAVLRSRRRPVFA